MYLRSRLLIVGFCIVLAAVSLLLVTGKLNTCPAALIGSEQQITGPLLCQLEFFLNRYQTLLGSLIALSAAIYAVGPVWRQLRLLSVQAATDLLPHLLTEAKELAADEGFLANANDVASRLHAARECSRDPQSPRMSELAMQLARFNRSDKRLCRADRVGLLINSQVGSP